MSITKLVLLGMIELKYFYLLIVKRFEGNLLIIISLSSKNIWSMGQNKNGLEKIASKRNFELLPFLVGVVITV